MSKLTEASAWTFNYKKWTQWHVRAKSKEKQSQWEARSKSNCSGMKRENASCNTFTKTWNAILSTWSTISANQRTSKSSQNTAYPIRPPPTIFIPERTGSIVRCTIGPFEESVIATISVNPKKGYALRLKFSAQEKEPPKAIVKSLLKPIEKEIEKLARAGKVDLKFPPNAQSIGNINTLVHWRRPEEFTQGVTRLWDEINANNMQQGRLGNCW